MKMFSTKKLFFSVCFALLTVSTLSFTKIRVAREENDLIISIEEEKRKKKITIRPVDFTQEMDLADKTVEKKVFSKKLARAKKELGIFDRQLTMIGENLATITKGSVEQKDDIAMFLLMQIPAIIDLRVALEPTVAMGQTITMGDGRIILNLLKRTSKKGKPESKKLRRAKIKALVAAKQFLKGKYPKVKALANRLQAVGQTASALVQDLERKRR